MKWYTFDNTPTQFVTPFLNSFVYTNCNVKLGLVENELEHWLGVGCADVRLERVQEVSDSGLADSAQTAGGDGQ